MSISTYLPRTAFGSQWGRTLVTTVKAVLGWPARIAAARRAMTELGRFSDCELRDIGLTRQDLGDATALGFGQDPTALFARRAWERRTAARVSRAG